MYSGDNIYKHFAYWQILYRYAMNVHLYISLNKILFKIKTRDRFDAAKSMVYCVKLFDLNLYQFRDSGGVQSVLS